MDEKLQSVDSCDLSFTTLVGASHNGDFVVFSDGDAADLLGFVRIEDFFTSCSTDSGVALVVQRRLHAERVCIAYIVLVS